MSRKLKPQPTLTVAKKQPPRWQQQRRLSLFIWIIIPVIIALVLGLVGYWGYDNYIAAWQRPIVKVNETTFDMDYYVKMLRFYSQNPSLTANKALFPYQVLSIIEDNELIREAAPRPEFDIHVSPGNITETINNLLVPPTAGNTTQPATNLGKLYEQLLDQVRLSDNEYRQLVEIDLLRQELTKYLKEHDVPAEAEQIYLHFIPFANEEQASLASDQLKQGGNFTAVADEFSMLAGIEEFRSEIGWVPRGIYSELDEVAFELEVGNVTEPISTAQGYYIIKISERAESRPIENKFREILADSEFAEWLQQERQDSIIEEYINQDKIDWALDQIN